ncbi:MAG: aldo/keto reductase [Alphaproteobacteria bacterium]
MKTVTLPSGESVPTLGLGTWRMGESAGARKAEVAALRAGIDLGLTLIDSAEMYGEGDAEKVVGEAVAGRRDEVFLVSKVYPHNATRDGAVAACERSLRRLGTDRLDLYLLHWRGDVPLGETIEAFEALVTAGKIRYFGVSNFDTADMDELFALCGGSDAATDQVLYNLLRRGVEWDLIPWCRKRGLPVMAYTPLGEGRLDRHPALAAIAERHGAAPLQIVLAWLLREDGVIAIPKAASIAHLRENRAALDLRLSADDLVEIDRAFPPPVHAEPLVML